MAVEKSKILEWSYPFSAFEKIIVPQILVVNS